MRVITGQVEATGLDSPAQVLAPLFVVQSVTVTVLPDLTLAVVLPVIAVVNEDFRDARAKTPESSAPKTTIDTLSDLLII